MSSNVQLIKRDIENVIRINRSSFPMIYLQIQLVLVLFFLAIALVFIYLVLLKNLELQLIMIILFIVLAAFVLLTYVIRFMYYKSIKYYITPGYVQKTANEIIDQIPGKIIIESGLLSKKTIRISAHELDKVDIYQDLFGKYLNFGTIKLQQIDKLQSISNYSLRNVKNPQTIAGIIQKEIDLQITQTQPM